MSSSSRPRLPLPRHFQCKSSQLGNSMSTAIQVAAEFTFVRQSCVFAAIALLLYETCLTVNLELRYIWARGRARVILLFVTIRHLQLANLVLTAVSPTYHSSGTCQALSIINGVLLVLSYVGWAVFLAWRAYALSSSSASVGMLVFICGVAFASPSLLGVVGTTSTYSTTQSFCITTWWWADGRKVQAYLIYASRVLNILGEVVVLVLTCKATYRAWRSSKSGPRPASLPDVLCANGLLCFCAVTFLHTVTAVLSVIGPTNLISNATVAVFRDALVTILLSRFILELGKVGTITSVGGQGDDAPGGILTTEWTGEISGVPSQWTLDDEYNGRGFDKDIDSFDIKGSMTRESWRAGVPFTLHLTILPKPQLRR